MANSSPSSTTTTITTTTTTKPATRFLGLSGYGTNFQNKKIRASPDVVSGFPRKSVHVKGKIEIGHFFPQGGEELNWYEDESF